MLAIQDRVVGKTSAYRGWNGTISEIVYVSGKRKFRVAFDRLLGQTVICSKNAIQKSSVILNGELNDSSTKSGVSPIKSSSGLSDAAPRKRLRQHIDQISTESDKDVVLSHYLQPLSQLPYYEHLDGNKRARLRCRHCGEMTSFHCGHCSDSRKRNISKRYSRSREDANFHAVYALCPPHKSNYCFSKHLFPLKCDIEEHPHPLDQIRNLTHYSNIDSSARPRLRCRICGDGTSYHCADCTNEETESSLRFVSALCHPSKINKNCYLKHLTSLYKDLS